MVMDALTLSDFEKEMIEQATSHHGRIYPCAHKGSFTECFTEDNGLRFFWFNTEDKSTHVITAKA